MPRYSDVKSTKLSKSRQVAAEAKAKERAEAKAKAESADIAGLEKPSPLKTSKSSTSKLTTPGSKTSKLTTSSEASTSAPKNSPPKSREPKTSPDPSTSPTKSPEPETSHDPSISPPKSPEPETSDPSTSPPKSLEPETSDPSTSPPKSLEPETSDPSTSPPKSLEPETSDPSTSPPKSMEPETSDPSTSPPKSLEPETSDPSTSPPKSREPETSDPSTSLPKSPETSSEPPNSELHIPKSEVAPEKPKRNLPGDQSDQNPETESEKTKKIKTKVPEIFPKFPVSRPPLLPAEMGKNLGAVPKVRGEVLTTDVKATLTDKDAEIGTSKESEIDSSKHLEAKVPDRTLQPSLVRDPVRMNVESGTLRPPRLPERPGTARSFDESLESAQLRRLCTDFLDFKNSHLNKQKKMESEMKRLFPRMDIMLKQVDALSRRISRIPMATPDNETNLRVENDRLNYLITTSAGVFKQIDIFLLSLKDKIDSFTSLTTNCNEGIDDRLKKVIKALCERSDHHQTDSSATSVTQTSGLSTVSEAPSTNIGESDFSMVDPNSAEAEDPDKGAGVSSIADDPSK